MPLLSFYTPWKHQKTRGFGIFSGGKERDQSHDMIQKDNTWSKGMEWTLHNFSDVLKANIT